jgi:hypothetical protein
MRYPVIQAKRLETKYGMRVVVVLSEEGGNIIEEFLTKRYGDDIDDSDMADIKSKRLQYYLFYKGKRLASSALILQMEL